MFPTLKYLDRYEDKRKWSQFVRVSHYRGWIEKNMEAPEYCRGGLSSEPKTSDFDSK